MMDKEFNIKEFYITTTCRCFLRCIMCTTGADKHPIEDELSTEEWKRAIINLNKACKINRITFGGGEPLVRKDMVEIIKFTCSTDVANINIVSNGILLNEEFMNNFNENELSKIGFNISIDGLEYEHDFIRGTGVFQKTLKNFELLYHNYFRREKISQLVINSILMPENFRNFIPFLEYFFKKYEGVRVDIQPVIPNNEICWLKKQFMLTDLEKNKLREIVDYVVDNDYRSCRDPAIIKSYIKYFNNELLKSERCTDGREALNITYKGNPYLCGRELFMPVHKIPFKDIFYSNEYQNELRRIDACRKPCLQGLHIDPENYKIAEEHTYRVNIQDSSKFNFNINQNNMEEYKFKSGFRRLYDSIFRKLQPPEAIEWFPTYLCNSKCQYCGGYDKETISSFGKLVPYKKIIKIIKLSGESGTVTWNIGGRGGEPLLYPNLIEVLEAIKQYNMKGILITNGLSLDEGFITRLINSKWDIFRISFDSHIPEIQDEIRGLKGNFDKIDKALILFKKIKEENNMNLPRIVCCPVITNKNYKYIPGYIEYCIEREVDEIQFMPLLNVHERAEKLMTSQYQRNELVCLLEKVICEGKIKHNIDFIASLYKNNTNIREERPSSEPDINSKLYCVHLWKTLVISEDGYLSPCSLIKDKLLKINGSHLKAWDSKIINELRIRILNGEFINSACKECCGPLRQETENFKQYLLNLT